MQYEENDNEVFHFFAPPHIIVGQLDGELFAAKLRTASH